jgi:hypothetical protein
MAAGTDPLTLSRQADRLEESGRRLADLLDRRGRTAEAAASAG